MNIGDLVKINEGYFGIIIEIVDKYSAYVFIGNGLTKLYTTASFRVQYLPSSVAVNNFREILNV